MKPLPPGDKDPDEKDEGFTISPADVTSRIRVDPWTGQVIPEYPEQPPRPLLRPKLRPDPDRTNEVEIDPTTGRVVSTRQVGPRLTFGRASPAMPDFATLEIADPAPDTSAEVFDADSPQEKTREIDVRPYQAQMTVTPEPTPWLSSIGPTPAPSTPTPTRPSSPAPLRASSPAPPRPSTPPPVRSSAPPPIPPAAAPPQRQSAPPPVPPDARPSRPPVPGGDAPAPPFVAPGFDSDEPWAASTRDDLVASTRRTLGMKLVAVVAFLALAIGASLGIAMTIMLVDGDEAADAQPKPPVGSAPSTPRPSDGGPAGATPPGPDRNVAPPPAPPDTPDAAPPQVPTKLTALDQLVLPISFPRNGFDPEHLDTARLKQIAELMVKDRSLEVDVIGYAAVDEDPEAVERLASRRAKLAASLLSSYGPSRSRFAVRSGGASAEHGRRVVLQVKAR